MNDVYVVLKLVSGETLMSVLGAEDENFVQLNNPLVIKSVPSLADGREHLAAAPFCPFTEDSEFILDKRDVMFIKNLAEPFIKTYIRLTESEEDERPEREAEDDGSYRFIMDGNDTIN
jgi:hypothetical protein